jgi:DNA-binding XRE family transcriptional regulator
MDAIFFVTTSSGLAKSVRWNTLPIPEMQLAPVDDGVECWSLAGAANPGPGSRPVSGLGGEIRRRRHAIGYSQETLADLVGVDRTQIGVLERGDGTMSIHTFRLVAIALGTKMSEILGHVGF